HDALFVEASHECHSYRSASDVVYGGDIPWRVTNRISPECPSVCSWRPAHPANVEQYDRDDRGRTTNVPVLVDRGELLRLVTKLHRAPHHHRCCRCRGDDLPSSTRSLGQASSCMR